MKTSRLWLIAGIAAVVAVVIGISAAIATANAPAAPAPTATASPSPPAPDESPDPTPVATPTPTPTTSGGAFSPSCENTATAAFLARMQGQGWTAKDISREPGGFRPFDDFLDGMPEISVVCRWSADPDTATGPATHLAWTILPAEAIGDFIQRQTEAGAVMTTTPEGTYLETSVGGAYLFTESDARWAATRAELAEIKAPHDE